jgi:hypothetical protein
VSRRHRRQKAAGTESEIATLEVRNESAEGLELRVVPAPPKSCDRLIVRDSIRWHCACGASGPVGRSKDGIPYVDGEILAHEPGEQRS